MFAAPQATQSRASPHRTLPLQDVSWLSPLIVIRCRSADSSGERQTTPIARRSSRSPVVSWRACGGEEPEHAAVLVVRAGSEEQLARVAVRSALAELQCPETIDHERRSIL